MAYLERASVGGRIFYQVRGSGPPLVLLNGLSQSTANWTSQVTHLAERYTVITWDCRGQGRSEAGEGALDLDAHTSDLAALLDALGHERAHLVGFSHGARVALAFADRFPARVDRLVVTSIGADDAPLRAVILRTWKAILELGGVEALAWCSTTHIMGPAFLEANVEHLEVMVKTTVQRNTEAGLRRMMEAIVTYPPTLVEATRVRVPTLVVTADRDPLCSPEAGRRLTEALPRGRHVLVEGSGHTIPVEEPRRWRDEVVAFLEGGVVG